MKSLLTQPLYSDLTDGSGRARLAYPYCPQILPAVPEAPVGLVTDWASVPDLVECLLPGMRARLGQAGPAWHDAGYQSGGFGGRYTRQEVDTIFLALLLLDGVSPGTAIVAFHAVRDWAASHWQGSLDPDDGREIAPTADGRIGR